MLFRHQLLIQGPAWECTSQLDEPQRWLRVLVRIGRRTSRSGSGQKGHEWGIQRATRTRQQLARLKCEAQEHLITVLSAVICKGKGMFCWALRHICLVRSGALRLKHAGWVGGGGGDHNWETLVNVHTLPVKTWAKTLMYRLNKWDMNLKIASSFVKFSKISKPNVFSNTTSSPEGERPRYYKPRPTKVDAVQKQVRHLKQKSIYTVDTVNAVAAVTGKYLLASVNQ